MKVTRAKIADILILEPDVFTDERGYFLESYNEKNFRDAGIAEKFVQDNLSFSRQGVLRGLHFQYLNPQGKLVYVLEGEVFDVAVDIRRDSPNFGKWLGLVLSAKNKKQLYIPSGFAHGFQVISETALFAYKCTEFYHRDSDRSILWSDPDIGITWPFQKPVLSGKDANASRLAQIHDLLPAYEGDVQ